MSSPLFSCIIPVFNRAHTIKRAVESVLSQSLKDFELIVVDDGSTDELHSQLRPYIEAGKLRLVRQENFGVSKARNTGAKNARGVYLAFLDSDDEWLPDKLLLQKELLASSGRKLAHGEEVWLWNGKKVSQKRKHKKGGGDQFLPSLELCLIAPSATVIEKELYFELGGFREDFPVCEDYDLWLKVTSLMDIGFIEEPIVVKHGGAPDQLSFQYKGMDYWRCLSILWALQNRELSREREHAAKSVLMKKIEIMLEGLNKKGPQDPMVLNEIQKVEALKKKALLL